MNDRQGVRLLAQLEVRDLDDTAGPPHRARDIAVGGVYLFLDAEWPVGLTRRLAIDHGATTIELEARVVRSEERGAALRFVDPTPELRSQLRRLLIDLVYEGADISGHRDTHRIRTTSPVLWTYGNAQIRSHLEDLSTTGATITTVKPPPLGSELFVRIPVLEVRGGTPVVDRVQGCQARVLRHTDNGFAVKFIGVSDEFRDAVVIWQGNRRNRSSD